MTHDFGRLRQRQRIIVKARGVAESFRVAPEELKQRTLTALYNQRPQWLEHLHVSLDTTVCTAYGWPAHISDSEILQNLLTLNENRAARFGIPYSDPTAQMSE